MDVRRVVTGTDARGKSVFLSDDVAPHSHDFPSMPGNRSPGSGSRRDRQRQRNRRGYTVAGPVRTPAV